MNTGWVLTEKWVELVRLVVGRKMSKTSKGRGLPDKWQNNEKYENGVVSSRKHDKMNMRWVVMEKWAELVRLIVGHKMVKTDSNKTII